MPFTVNFQSKVCFNCKRRREWATQTGLAERKALYKCLAGNWGLSVFFLHCHQIPPRQGASGVEWWPPGSSSSPLILGPFSAPFSPMISHLSQEKATGLNKSCRVIAWWGPVVPRHWVKRPPNWFHWGANSDLNPVFQRWKRAIDFRHTQFRTETITVLTVSGCAHLLEMSVVAHWKRFFFGLNSILYISEETESKRTVSSSGEPWGPLLLISTGERGSQDGSRAGLWQEESSLREHTSLQPPASSGAQAAFVTCPLLQLWRPEKREPLSPWKGHLLHV